jgi:hypothetical protein
MLSQTASGATFTADFNSGAAPAGMTVYEPAKIVATGGVGGSGYLSLTDAIGSQQGSAVIEEFNGGQPIGGFTARMKLQISGGGNQPADGFSFNYGTDIADGTFGEEGTGTGLIVSLDTYDNGGGEAPALDVSYGGTQIAHTKFAGVTTLTIPPIIDPATGQPATFQTGTNFLDMIIDLKPNGTLNVVYKGIVVYTNLVLPGYTAVAGRFGLGARTGGAVETHWVDDLNITTVAPATGAPTVLQQPASATVDERGTVTFSVVPNGEPPFTFQWSRNGVAIQDATSSTLTITNAAFTDNNARYKVNLSNASGNVDSAEAVLTVRADTLRPTVSGVIASDNFTNITVTFSEPVTAASAGNRANYTLSGGATVSAVEVIGDRSVRLTTSRLTAGTDYTLSIAGVQDTAATPNALAANTTATVATPIAMRGGLKFEAFRGITGTAVQMLLDDPKYQANTPDVVAFVTNFSSRVVFPDGPNNDYGGRISGWIVPPETAQYEFFVRSDDASQLFLSTDDTAANAALIAEETGCCGPFEEPGAPETSLPQSLVSGRRYYIMGLWKEGGGGDYLDVAWRKVGDTTSPRALTYIPGSVLETFAPANTFTPPTVAISSPANNSSVAVGSPLTLTATASAATGKTITRVEFFELGQSRGAATASPYTLTLQNLSEDVHVFTARATDSAGMVTESAPVSISVGTPVRKVTLLAINASTIWKYDRSGQDLGEEWRQINYNDAAWPQGPALIADETTTTVEPIRTAISRLTDDGTYIKTFYFRGTFNWTDPIDPAGKLQLRHVVDDGAVIYLNGKEIHRFNIAADAVVDATTDASGHENAYEGPYDIPITNLVAGKNVLAVEVHQSGGSSSDMVFGAELTATVPVGTPPGGQPMLTITRNASGLQVSWTEGGTLQSSDTVTGGWADVPGASPQSITIAPGSRAKFYRVRK